MLAVIRNESFETKDLVLKELQRRAAVARRSSQEPRGVRYSPDFQEGAATWVKASGLSLRDAASALGVSFCSVRRWVQQGSAFRAVNIIDAGHTGTTAVKVDQAASNKENSEGLYCSIDKSIVAKTGSVGARGGNVCDQNHVAEISVGVRVTIRVGVSALQPELLAALAQL